MVFPVEWDGCCWVMSLLPQKMVACRFTSPRSGHNYASESCEGTLDGCHADRSMSRWLAVSRVNMATENTSGDLPR